MPRAEGTKVWNEDLTKALRARADTARRQGKRSAVGFDEAAAIIENVRGDIYQFKTGRLVNYPHKKLSATIDRLCRNIIAESEPIYPPGFVSHAVTGGPSGNPYRNDPYLKTIKNRGGAFAILMAFHVSDNKVLTKDQLCDTGQAFCDEAMRENFHAGLLRGAWAANKTLVRHNLITAHRSVGYSERAGGLRSTGPSTFALTENGKRFIEALLEARPDIQRQIDVARGQGVMGTERVSHSNVHGFSTGGSFGIVNPYAKRGFAKKSASPHKSGNKFYQSDEQELRAWLETATVGQQKEFAVGKDRRSNLHDVCDTISASLDGCRLLHESGGAGRSRSLFVTLVATAPRGNMSKTPPRRTSMMSSESLTPSPPRTLGGETPAKRRLVPASVAAANAAYERMVMNSSQKVTPSSTMALKKKPPPTKKSPPAKCSNIFADDSDSDDSLLYPYGIRPKNDLDGQEHPKPKMKPFAKAVSNTDNSGSTDEKQSASSRSLPTGADVVCLIESSSDEDDWTTKHTQTRPAAKKQLFRDAAETSSSDEEVKMAIQASLRGTRPKRPIRVHTPPLVVDRQSLQNNMKRIIIGIDDRERNRNATPRLLRMELTRLLSTGPSALVWSGLPQVEVEERRLLAGDFSLVGLSKSGMERPFPVLVERKRVGDLVQRSFSKDHWFQLHRMRQTARINVLLLEGEPRTAAQYTAYGAHDVEEYSPYSHTIDDEESLFRFFGRAILNGRFLCVYRLILTAHTCTDPFSLDHAKSTRFIQTKDEQSSLRMVGALSLMSLFATPTKQSVEQLPRIDAKAERVCLRDRLCQCALPFRLAERVSEEVPSIAAMDRLFESTDAHCRPQLFLPVIRDVVGGIVDLSGTALSWSRAIHAAWYSKDRAAARLQFHEIKGLVEDHALLLVHLHSGLGKDEAIDAVLSSQQLLVDSSNRIVHIEMPLECVELFQVDGEGRDSFFKIQTKDWDRDRQLPCISMQTKDRNRDKCSCSMPLNVYLMDGTDIVDRVRRKLQRDTADTILAAKQVAHDIGLQMEMLSKPYGGQCAMIVRGFYNALEQAAKKPDYILETLIVGTSRFLRSCLLSHRTFCF